MSVLNARQAVDMSNLSGLLGLNGYSVGLPDNSGKYSHLSYDAISSSYGSIDFIGNYSVKFPAQIYAGTIDTLATYNGSGNQILSLDVTLPTGKHAGDLFDAILYARSDSASNTKLTDLLFSGHDTLNGSAQNDTLLGFKGNDTINGGAGNDVLGGGLGSDKLTGGLGNDTYDYNTVAEIIGDTVYFGAGDKIDLSTIDANTRIAGNQAFFFDGNNTFEHKSGELRVVKASSYSLLQGDTNGDGKADFSLTVMGVTGLNGSMVDL